MYAYICRLAYIKRNTSQWGMAHSHNKIIIILFGLLSILFGLLSILFGLLSVLFISLSATAGLAILIYVTTFYNKFYKPHIRM